MQAAEVPSIHYTIKDGLPSNMVYDVYQDDQGYIWLATDKGISRYNGLTFKNYTTDDGLSDNECFYFRKDLYGRLWIATYNGSLMYYKDGIFHTAANTPFLHLPFKSTITHTIIPEADSSVTILFNTFNVLVSVRKNRLKINYIKINTSNLVYARKSGADNYEIRYTGKPYQTIIDTLSRILETRENDTRYFPLKGVAVSHNGIHLISNTAVYRQDQSLLITLPPGFSTRHTIRWVLDHPAGPMIGTNNGLFINDQLLLKDKNISSFVKDRDGNYWISTLNDGVYKLNGALLQSLFLPDSYKKPVVYAAAAANGLLFGTLEGNIYCLQHDNVATIFNTLQKTGGRIPLAETTHLWDGYRYFCFGKNVNELTGHNRILTNLFSAPTTTNITATDDSVQIRASSVIKNNQYIYVSASRRYIFFSLYTDLLRQKKIGRKKIFPVKEEQDRIINGIGQAPDSSLWFSTVNHLYLLKDSVVRVQNQFGRLGFKSLIINRNCLAGRTFDNKLMICSQYTSNNISIDTIVADHCLWDKFYAINDSIILVTTNNLYRLIITHPSDGKPIFDIRIPEQQFIPQLAEYIYSDGNNCYFFKDKSVTRLPVSSLLAQVSPPSIFFSQLQTADSQIIGIDSIVRLSYNKAQNISIGFTALSLNTKDLDYEYAIRQGDDSSSWVKSNGENINIYKLGSGEYTISIRAKTPAGTYSKVSSFVLIINRPFWLSWWFLLIDAAIIGGLTWLLIKYYTRKATARKEEELQQKEQEMKFLKSEYKALNALMNPHFIFNTLNSVQSLINKDDKQASSEHIRTVADLIRQNMHNVARDLITLEEELTLVINYLKLEQLRFSWLHFELHIDDDIDTDDIMVPPLILQPLVENAILHGLWPAKRQQGIINIQVMKKEKSIVINISDNGKGFSNNTNKDRNPNHKSTAVNNISSRMHQLSAMHGKSYTFQIEELKNGEMITGVTATIEIEI